MNFLISSKPFIKNNFYLTALLLLIYGCNGHEKGNALYPSNPINQLENLAVYSPYTPLRDSVKLIKETVFETNEDIFISGYISHIAVDDSDRVYIGTNTKIYVFHHDGGFLTTLGSEGRGPGEFESIGSINVWNNQLYIFDPRLQKYSVFGTDSFELEYEELIRRETTIETDSLLNRLRGQELIVAKNGKLIIQMGMISPNENADLPIIAYYELLSDGVLSSGSILEIERFPFYYPTDGGEMNFPFTMPFTPSSLVATTNDGRFYTAWTEDFLVKVYDEKGQYDQAIYYPVEQSSLSLNELTIDRERQRVLNEYAMPEFWPALHTMTFDDKERLWVATITDSNRAYSWWVLDLTGKTIARFSFPGNRLARNVMSNPITEIRNGYFYDHEFDFQEGIDRIVKYKISFIQNRM